MRERRIEIALLECGERFVEIVPVACSGVRNRKGSQERMFSTAAGEMGKVTLEKKHWKKVRPEKQPVGNKRERQK